MSYRLEDGIRRIVAEELDDAIAGLRAGDDRDTAIHEARKSLKKARSALRLARTDLPASTIGALSVPFPEYRPRDLVRY